MIYADYNGSAPLCRNVVEHLKARLEKGGPYANPNAIHHLGAKCLMALEKSRKICADALGAGPEQIIFNSGASEGISTVFHTLVDRARKHGKKLIITSGIEHSACVSACQFYAAEGFEILTLHTHSNGQIDTEHLAVVLAERNIEVAFVNVMAANNETGVIQDWQHIVSLCQKYSIPYFSDTTQWIGKTPFHFQNSGMDYAVMSGHKVGAMTGVGIVLAKDPSTLKPIIFGGGQERGLRGGTQNYLAIETLAVALKDNNENLQKMAALKQAREQFEASIKKQFPQVVIMGENAPRLATTTFISYPGIHGQAVQIELESQNIFVTTSSACSDNMPVTSKVLKAMKINDDVGRGVVRISLGPCAPVELYQELGTGLAKAYQKLEKIKFSGNRT